MAIPETEGERLREAMRAKGITQAMLGGALHVGAVTVGRWVRNQAAIPERHIAEVARLVHRSEAWLRTGQNGGGVVREAAAAPAYGARGGRQPGELPYEVRVWLQGFLLEIARDGATQDEIDRARVLLTRQDSLAWYAGGYSAGLDEARVLKGMTEMARFIRAMVQERQRESARAEPR